MDKPQRSAADEYTETYVGRSVALQRMKVVQFGRANQRWRYDASSGLIYAFDTNSEDKGDVTIVCAPICSMLFSKHIFYILNSWFIVVFGNGLYDIVLTLHWKMVLA